MKIAIVGSRKYPMLQHVKTFVRSLPRGSVVVSGGARGVDLVAEREAVRQGLGTDIYLPDWETYGKKAAFRRNAFIVDACDELVAFWDGTSRGTMHTVRLALNAGKAVTVYDATGRILAVHERRTAVPA